MNNYYVNFQELFNYFKDKVGGEEYVNSLLSDIYANVDTLYIDEEDLLTLLDEDDLK